MNELSFYVTNNEIIKYRIHNFEKNIYCMNDKTLFKTYLSMLVQKPIIFSMNYRLFPPIAQCHCISWTQIGTCLGYFTQFRPLRCVHAAYFQVAIWLLTTHLTNCTKLLCVKLNYSTRNDSSISKFRTTFGIALKL